MTGGQPPSLKPSTCTAGKPSSAAIDGGELSQPVIHLDEIGATIDHEFELIVVSLGQLPNHIRAMPRRFVPRGPATGTLSRRCRAGQLRANRHQVALDRQI